MTKKYLVITIFALAIVLGVLTRFYKLGEAPAGLYLDEAAQGYNAYSILKTGKDEFGKSFPIVFRSFTEFKTPVYIYLVVPLIPLFGLTPFTVRLPSFIFSILTFPVLFLLLKKISPSKIALPVSLLTVLLLAISPWHILFGRTNFECNVALFFLIAGLYFFYKGLEKPIWLTAASIMFAIAIPAYHSQRIVTPAMLLVLAIKYRHKLFSKGFLPFTVIGLIMGVVISLPTLSVATTPGFLARAAGLNIFSSQKLPAGFLEDYQGPLGWLVNSSWFLSLSEFVSLYVSYFSPRNMFVLGDSGGEAHFRSLQLFIYGNFLFIFMVFTFWSREKNLASFVF